MFPYFYRDLGPQYNQYNFRIIRYTKIIFKTGNILFKFNIELLQKINNKRSTITSFAVKVYSNHKEKFDVVLQTATLGVLLAFSRLLGLDCDAGGSRPIQFVNGHNTAIVQVQQENLVLSLRAGDNRHFNAGAKGRQAARMARAQRSSSIFAQAFTSDQQ